LKKINVLYLVEHVAREMDVACAVKAILEEKYQCSVAIRHIYYDLKKTLNDFQPDVIVFPFFYKDTDLAMDECLALYPGSTYLNLTWEELYYPTNVQLKVPKGEHALHDVFHHVWGDFFRDYLLSHGVTPDHIIVNGQPAYQLYFLPYCLYYKNRQQLAEEYGLDLKKHWVFIPENYRWGFIDDGKVERLVRDGASRDEIITIRDFCQRSVYLLMEWSMRFARENDIEVIFRPRPATQISEVEAMARKILKDNEIMPVRFHILKNDSVREWILSSDIVISSYSTTLIEAAIVDKPIFMFEPLQIPASLKCSWYNNIPRIVSYEDFSQAIFGSAPDSGNDSLKKWALNMMLSHGDPIDRLASIIADLVKRQSQNPIQDKNQFFKFPFIGHFITNLKMRKKFSVNPRTHESDHFSDKDVRMATIKWKKILFNT